MKNNFTFGIPNDGGNFTEIFQISGKKIGIMSQCELIFSNEGNVVHLSEQTYFARKIDFILRDTF